MKPSIFLCLCSTRKVSGIVVVFAIGREHKHEIHDKKLLSCTKK